MNSKTPKLMLAIAITMFTYSSTVHALPFINANSIGGFSLNTTSTPTGGAGQVYAYSESLNFAVNAAVTLNGVPVAAPLIGPGFGLLGPGPLALRRHRRHTV